MKEQELIRRIQEETEATPIPEHLSPEHIADELSHQSIKKKWYQHPWVNMAAGLLIVGIIGGLVWNSHFVSKQFASNSDSMLSEEMYMEDANDTIDNSASAESEGQNLQAKERIQTASDYHQIYQILSNLTVQAKYTDELLESVEDMETDTVPSLNANTSSSVQNTIQSTQNERSYYDTNSQVNGVAEADIVKTDGTYIYSAYRQGGYEAVAVAIAKTNDGKLESCGIITSESILNELSNNSKIELTESQTEYGYYINELYVVNQRLILLCETNDFSSERLCIDSIAGNHSNTHILIYDISNPKNPNCLSALTQEGRYKSSRFTDDCLYTFTEKWSYIPDKYQSYNDYIPHTEEKLLTSNCIYLPECPDSSCFQIMTGMKLSEPEEFVSSKAILSGNGIYYVSENNIYFAQEKWNCGTAQTELLTFSYEDGAIEPEGSVVIDGYLLNQFSMDEYNGFLRIAVTCPSSYDAKETDSLSVQTNALYVIDSSMKLVGCIDNLAPEERIYSVRFMGDTGYFVTYRETDPLFSVDLSDPSHPQIMDALKIPGFSNYLHFYSENLLLGLGEEIDPVTGNFMGLKLSMFDISDPYDIKETDKIILPDSCYSPAQDNHKALMIDPERNLIGFYVEYYDKTNYENFENYVIYSYSPDNGFEQQFTCHVLEDKVLSGDNTNSGQIAYYIRGLYIGNYLYLVNENCICSYSLDGYQKIDELQIKE